LRPFRSALGTDDIAFHHHLEKRDVLVTFLVLLLTS
jgi:hypothetical protein